MARKVVFDVSAAPRLEEALEVVLLDRMGPFFSHLLFSCGGSRAPHASSLTVQGRLAGVAA